LRIEAQEAREELIASRALLLATIDELTKDNVALMATIKKLTLDNSRLLRARRVGKKA
jgi:hypothetical protein